MEQLINKYFYSNFLSYFVYKDNYLNSLIKDISNNTDKNIIVEDFINSNTYLNIDIQIISYDNERFKMYITKLYNNVEDKTKLLNLYFNTINSVKHTIDTQMNVNYIYDLDNTDTLQYIKGLILKTYQSIILNNNIKQSNNNINKLNKI